MEKNTMILKNGTAIIYENGSGLSNLQVVYASKSDMLETWQQMTPDNLSEVKKGNEEGNFSDLVLASETSVERSDGSILTTYHLREKTTEEKLIERVKALEETTDILTMEALVGGETA